MAASVVLANTLTQQTMRHFSAQAPKTATRLQSAVASTIIGAAVVLPFVPPALESKRERDLGHPNANRKQYAPFCCHT
jgi:hypothetical protein